MARTRILPYLGFLALAAATACGGASTAAGADGAAPTSPTSEAPTGATPSEPATEPPRSTQPRPSPTRTGPPPFTAKIQKVDRATLKHSWRPGCPVPVEQLRMIVMPHWGFDGKVHTGRLVVHRSVAEEVAGVFKKLYGWRFPIRRMELVDKYGGSDYRSIDADNTSAFNCRPATGSSSWSKHAYGKAIDLNPRENPWVNADGTNEHRNADAFVKRPLNKPGVINPGDRVVKAFEQVGWEWGGYWSGAKDYQHFSKGGG
jgi:hypothetical protein